MRPSSANAALRAPLFPEQIFPLLNLAPRRGHNLFCWRWRRLGGRFRFRLRLGHVVKLKAEPNARNIGAFAAKTWSTPFEDSVQAPGRPSSKRGRIEIVRATNVDDTEVVPPKGTAALQDCSRDDCRYSDALCLTKTSLRPRAKRFPELKS